MFKNLSGGRMTKWKGHAASMAPSGLSISVVALVAAGAGVAHAQSIDPNTVIDSEVTTRQIIDDSVQTFTITPNGSINITGRAVPAIVAFGPETPAIVINNGTISVTGDGTRAAGFLGYSALTGAIENTGTITVNTNVSTNAKYAEAAGIAIFGDVADGARITNTNTISTTVNVTAVEGQQDFTAQNVGIAGISTANVLGEVQNTGDIVTNLNLTGGEYSFDTFTRTSSDTSSVSGIETGSIGRSFYDSETSTYISDSGTVNNGGKITLTVNLTKEEGTGRLDNEASGIDANALTADSSLTNSGDIVISQTVTGHDGYINTDGFSRSGEDSTSISGSGIRLERDNFNMGPRSIMGPSLMGHSSAYGDISDGAAFNNTGKITVTQTMTGNQQQARADAYGIDVNSIQYDSSLTNGGDIVISQTLSGKNVYNGANAYGIDVNRVSDGSTLANSGDIIISQSLTSETFSSRADAYGIEANSVRYGSTLTNSGEIIISQSLSGDADVKFSDAVGIRSYSASYDSSISNIGDITVIQEFSGTTEYGKYSGAGINARNITVNSTLTNSGDIVISQTGSGDVANVKFASAYGIGGEDSFRHSRKEGDGEDVTINNSGDIFVVQEFSGSADYGKYNSVGIRKDLNVNDSVLTNGGDIFVGQTLSGDGGQKVAFSAGIYAAVTASGSAFNNSGDILVGQEVSSDAEDSSATAGGIVGKYISDESTFTNSGDIAVLSTTTGNATRRLSASAYGLTGYYVAEKSSLDNSGDIAVIATASGSAANMRAYASGLFIGRIDSSATATNTGDIIVLAEATNSSIDPDATTTSEAVAVGIESLAGSFSNAGSLRASSNAGEAYAMRIFGDGEASTVSITANGIMEGRLLVDVNNLTITSTEETGSIYWTFDDLDANIENTDTVLTLDDANGPTLVRIGDVVTTLAGPSTESQSGDAQMLTEAVMMGGGKAMSALRGGGDDVAGRMHTAGGANGITAFADVDYISREYDDFDYDVTAVTGGVMGSLSNGIDYAVAATGFSAAGEITSSLGVADTSSDGFSLGAYGLTDVGPVTLGFGATLGTASNENERLVNDNSVVGGFSTIDAKFDTTFISPAVEVSYKTQLAGMTVTPRAGYRYTLLTAEAYQETGGPAASAIGERTVNVSDFTLGVDAARAVGSGVLTASADVLLRSVSGDDFDVALAGVSSTITGVSDDLTAIDLGIGYEMAVGAGMASIGASGMLGDVEGFGVSARYEMSF